MVQASSSPRTASLAVVVEVKDVSEVVVKDEEDGGLAASGEAYLSTSATCAPPPAHRRHAL